MNIQTRTISCFLLAFLAGVISQPGVAHAAELRGWEKADFGITHEELSRRLGQEAVVAWPKIAQDGVMYAPIEIPAREFFGVRFNVKFKFSRAEKLVGIDMTSVPTGDQANVKAEREDCAKVRAGLASKLGMAGVDSEEEGARGSLTASERKTTFEADNAFVKWTSLTLTPPRGKAGRTSHSCVVNYSVKGEAR